MALKEADTKNFETLLAAADSRDLCLVQSKDKATGEYRALVCAKWWDGDNICLLPLAQMVLDNPFEIYEDPTQCLGEEENE